MRRSHLLAIGLRFPVLDEATLSIIHDAHATEQIRIPSNAHSVQESMQRVVRGLVSSAYCRYGMSGNESDDWCAPVLGTVQRHFCGHDVLSVGCFQDNGE